MQTGEHAKNASSPMLFTLFGILMMNGMERPRNAIIIVLSALNNISSSYIKDFDSLYKEPCQYEYLQPIITQYFIDNKSEIWLLFLIAHSKR